MCACVCACVCVCVCVHVCVCVCVHVCVCVLKATVKWLGAAVFIVVVFLLLFCQLYKCFVYESLNLSHCDIVDI